MRKYQCPVCGNVYDWSWIARHLELMHPADPAVAEVVAARVEHVKRLMLPGAHGDGRMGASSVGDAPMDVQFAALLAQWRRETGMMSAMAQKRAHPAYQGIIRMGSAAIPRLERLCWACSGR